MGSYRKRLIALTVSGVIVSAPTLSNASEVQASFSDRWVEVSDEITVSIPQREQGDQKFAIFIGTQDATALFAPVRPGVYAYQSRILPLQPGEQRVKVYLIDANNQWEDAGDFTLKVLSKGGFEESEYTPSMTVTIDSMWDEGRSGQAPDPDRTYYHDGSLQASLQTRHAKGDLEITSSTNIVGATREENTLQFGDKGDAAPKVDLSDYLVEVRKGDAGLSVGHVSYGNNPLIFSGASNRGIVGTYRFNEYLDFGVTAQNGTSIVGFENLLGLKRVDDHHITGGTLGLEIIPDNPGAMRLELSYVDAQIESLNNFGLTEITDAEKSDGWGLRLLGNFFEGRLRYDASVARSTFTNPTDPFLDQGFNDVVAVNETTDDAHFVEVAYDIFTDTMIGDSIPVMATLTLTNERTDPLYRSLVASPTADIERYAANLQGSVGPVAMSLGYSESEDNIDNIASILKTRTEEWTGTLDASLAELFGDPMAEVQFWPSASLALQRVHQFAINSPATAISDFNTTNHLPDQMNDSANFSLNWSFNIWDVGYSWDYSKQDNRQTGRDQADFLTLGNSVNFGVRPLDNVSVTLSVGRSDTRDREQALHNISDTGSFAVDWQIMDNLAFNGSWNKSYDHDSNLLAKNVSEAIDLGLNYQFELPLTGERKAPGQFFLRYSNSDNKSRDNTFGFNTDAEAWTLTSGLSVNF